MDRRDLLLSAAGSAAGLLAVGSARPALAHSSAERSAQIRFCLNTSTIRDCKIDGRKLELLDQIRIASQAGYSGIELWLRDIQKYLDDGGTLKELHKRIVDAGLSVDSAIAFGKWLVDEDDIRKKGLEECAKDMEIIRELGGKRIAAPPTGMTDKPPMNLDKAADRYRALLELGKSLECVPQMEVWGFSTNFFSLKQVLYICAGASHPDACVLPDVYHLYKGGSDFADLCMLGGNRVQVFHMNDYPADPPRETIKDEHRVYPGDGVAPIGQVLRTMLDNGFEGVLSLELFNKSYWEQDPSVVAATGLAKMKEAVTKAFA
jgi:sugar phosphate isomerase/epimerase